MRASRSGSWSRLRDKGQHPSEEQVAQADSRRVLQTGWSSVSLIVDPRASGVALIVRWPSRGRSAKVNRVTCRLQKDGPCPRRTQVVRRVSERGPCPVVMVVRVPLLPSKETCESLRFVAVCVLSPLWSRFRATLPLDLSRGPRRVRVTWSRSVGPAQREAMMPGLQPAVP